MSFVNKPDLNHNNRANFLQSNMNLILILMFDFDVSKLNNKNLVHNAIVLFNQIFIIDTVNLKIKHSDNYHLQICYEISGKFYLFFMNQT